MSVAANMPARNVKGNVAPQDKILYVANKLGLSSLKYMQATTRVVYDTTDPLTVVGTGGVQTLFQNAGQKGFPLTNLGSQGNRFETNEALLIEKLCFFRSFTYDPLTAGLPILDVGQNVSVKFDLIIGNKTVIKDAVMEGGASHSFHSLPIKSSDYYLEGVGILIPPQVEFRVEARPFRSRTRDQDAFILDTTWLGCYLQGTGVLLNFNTSI
jgi:hypothetical protein